MKVLPFKTTQSKRADENFQRKMSKRALEKKLKTIILSATFTNILTKSPSMFEVHWVGETSENPGSK